MCEETWIAARNSQARFYRDIALYFKTRDGDFVLYKPPGMTLDSMRIANGRRPRVLYLKHADKIRGIREAQRGFNERLARDIRTEDVTRVRDTLVNIMEETLAEPRSGSLQTIPETVDTLISEYSKRPNVIKSLASISFKDYTTAIHSINVMSLTLGFCFHAHYSVEETKSLGLSSLLHDVGKTEIPTEILTAHRKLTKEEFQEIKSHTSIGYDILKRSEFSNEAINLGALEHHEKLDGSGYPQGITNISPGGQLLGIVDCYEALTNDDRPYRDAMSPLEALKLIKEDIEQGIYNRAIFEKLAYSLI